MLSAKRKIVFVKPHFHSVGDGFDNKFPWIIDLGKYLTTLAVLSNDKKLIQGDYSVQPDDKFENA